MTAPALLIRKGGLNGANEPSGGLGRFILIGDDIVFNGADRSAGDVSAINNVTANNSTFLGPRISNPFLSYDEGRGEDRGALAGGADAFGILAGITDEYFNLNFGADALAAVIRLDTVPATADG